jgi:hypothetical protein
MSEQTRSDQFQNAAPPRTGLIVVGIFDRRSDAEAAIGDLESAGFRRDDISLIMQQPERSEDPIGSGKTKADQGTVVGVSTGAVLGSIVGVAALAIPGVGALLAAGPIAAALGAMGGAALGGLVGSFTGLGIPSEDAKQFEQAVRTGRVVVAIKMVGRSTEAPAHAILERHQPHSISSYDAAS